jgi:membrane protein insertase Oxa1/YidC/SpoIIIJ
MSIPKTDDSKNSPGSKTALIAKDKNENPTEDFSAALQQSTKQTMFLFPIMIAFFSYSIPIGLSIYWIVQNTFVIIQTLVIKRIKSLEKKHTYAGTLLYSGYSLGNSRRSFAATLLLPT